MIGVVTSAVVLVCSGPIASCFGNHDVRKLLIFAAILPVLQNGISLLQIMFIAVGKAKHIAVRNMLVSILKLIVIIAVCYIAESILCIFIFQVATDILQILYFYLTLKKSGCQPSLSGIDMSLIREITAYCIPMAMSIIVRSLYRDCDKYVISFFTDPETFAVYTNASKQLPFDVVMASFCTVLLPYITRYASENRKSETLSLYRNFLELSFVTTSVLAIGAICVAPELMRFLYTEKYLASAYGLQVFTLYIMVDIFSVFTITLLLSAVGKTVQIMFVSAGAFALNILLDILLFVRLGEVGPALATLITTLLQGGALLSLSAKHLKVSVVSFFDIRFYTRFILESILIFFGTYFVRSMMNNIRVHYFLLLLSISALYCASMFWLNYGRIKTNIKKINRCRL